MNQPFVVLTHTTYGDRMPGPVWWPGILFDLAAYYLVRRNGEWVRERVVKSPHDEWAEKVLCKVMKRFEDDLLGGVDREPLGIFTNNGAR